MIYRRETVKCCSALNCLKYRQQFLARFFEEKDVCENSYN